jgi:uncharacterized protein
MKFLCDQMLGSLATWLRFLGYDTFYTNEQIDDQELLAIAKKEHRILLTRDKTLIAITKKQKVDLIPIETISLDEQLTLALKDKSINELKVLSRCSLCNTELRIASKNQVKDKVPPKVYDQYTLFWLCPKCDKAYWRGSHYDKILKKVNQLRAMKNH